MKEVGNRIIAVDKLVVSYWINKWFETRKIFNRWIHSVLSSLLHFFLSFRVFFSPIFSGSTLNIKSKCYILFLPESFAGEPSFNSLPFPSTLLEGVSFNYSSLSSTSLLPLCHSLLPLCHSLSLPLRLLNGFLSLTHIQQILTDTIESLYVLYLLRTLREKLFARKIFSVTSDSFHPNFLVVWFTSIENLFLISRIAFKSWNLDFFVLRQNSPRKDPRKEMNKLKGERGQLFSKSICSALDSKQLFLRRHFKSFLLVS